MPKDRKKNIARYKVDGATLNEFEFHQKQGELERSRDEDVWKVSKQTTNKATKKPRKKSQTRGSTE